MEPIKEENEVYVVFNGNKYYRGGYKGRGRGRGKPYERNSDQVRENKKVRYFFLGYKIFLHFGSF